MCKCHQLKEESKTGSENLRGKVTLNRKKSSKQVSSVQCVKKILSTPAARLFGQNKMQSIFHLAPKETKHSQIDPFLCDKHNHKTFPHPRGSAVFILKVWKKKFHGSFRTQFLLALPHLYFGANKMHLRSASVLHHRGIDLLTFPFHFAVWQHLRDAHIFREWDPLILLSSRHFFLLHLKKSYKNKLNML